ncbi:hypothetical protein AVEN_74541-1 [Araneus ventricosus]|uniref:Uncharacterized protein n=1 Tax=Araneus ventricosus TaxID=182803 RepID=A0A4Y2GS75_ARAVE|nr:hypothetical protein AVEN_74541-1 [Araneus ventricosus]
MTGSVTYVHQHCLAILLDTSRTHVLCTGLNKQQKNVPIEVAAVLMYATPLVLDVVSPLTGGVQKLRQVVPTRVSSSSFDRGSKSRVHLKIALCSFETGR